MHTLQHATKAGIPQHAVANFVGRASCYADFTSGSLPSSFPGGSGSFHCSLPPSLLLKRFDEPKGQLSLMDPLPIQSMPGWSLASCLHSANP